MTQMTTIHRFKGKHFGLAIERNEATGKVTVKVTPGEGMQWEQLALFQMECSPEEAEELAKLLAPASALARHVAEGGAVEHWRLF
jgi:hypothetical protein